MSTGAGGDRRQGAARFHPPSHVMAAFAELRLSLAARLLALALACKARRALNGRYYVWRGRKALRQLTGLSLRSLTLARRELLASGLFRAIFARQIETVDRVFEVGRGVPVLELVENREAFVQARERTRAADRPTVDAATHHARLEVQKRFLRGELTRDECRREEDHLRQQYRADRARRGREAGSPKGLTPLTNGDITAAGARGEAASPEGVKQLHRSRVKPLHGVG